MASYEEFEAMEAADGVPLASVVVEVNPAFFSPEEVEGETNLFVIRGCTSNQQPRQPLPEPKVIKTKEEIEIIFE